MINIILLLAFFSTVFITLCHLPVVFSHRICDSDGDSLFELHLLPLAVFIYMKSILITFKMTPFTYAMTSAITSNNVTMSHFIPALCLIATSTLSFSAICCRREILCLDPEIDCTVQ